MTIYYSIMYIYGFKEIYVNDNKHACKYYNYLLK